MSLNSSCGLANKSETGGKRLKCLESKKSNLTRDKRGGSNVGAKHCRYRTSPLSHHYHFPMVICYDLHSWKLLRAAFCLCYFPRCRFGDILERLKQSKFRDISCKRYINMYISNVLMLERSRIIKTSHSSVEAVGQPASDWQQSPTQ